MLYVCVCVCHRHRDNTKAADDEITRNLVGLAKTRPDIFGETPGTLLTYLT